MFCFCFCCIKRSKSIKSFNKIRKKNIKPLQRFYILNDTENKKDRNKIRILKLSTKGENSEIVNFEYKVKFKDYASKAFLSNAKLRFLNKCYRESKNKKEEDSKEPSMPDSEHEKKKEDPETMQNFEENEKLEDPETMRESEAHENEDPKTMQDSENLLLPLHKIKNEKLDDTENYLKISDVNENFQEPMQIKEEPIEDCQSLDLQLEKSGHLFTVVEINPDDIQGIGQDYEPMDIDIKEEPPNFMYDQYLTDSFQDFNSNSSSGSGAPSKRSKMFCEPCQKYFDFKADYNAHMKKRHQSATQKSVNSMKNWYHPPVPVSLKPGPSQLPIVKVNKTAVNSSSTKEIEILQKAKFKYNCSYCQKLFKYKSDAALHVRSAHSKQTFQLMKHTITDSSNKNVGKYRCIFCLVIFRFKSDCLAHGTKSHLLNCPDCKTNFNKMEDLERHCKTAHEFDIFNSTKKYTSQGWKAFPALPNSDQKNELPVVERIIRRETVMCMICSKFMSPKDAEYHSLEHVISNIEFECKKCSIKFKNSDCYKQHLELHEESEIALQQIATEVKKEVEEKKIEHYKNLIVRTA